MKLFYHTIQLFQILTSKYFSYVSGERRQQNILKGLSFFIMTDRRKNYFILIKKETKYVSYENKAKKKKKIIGARYVWRNWKKKCQQLKVRFFLNFSTQCSSNKKWKKKFCFVLHKIQFLQFKNFLIDSRRELAG